MVEKVITELKMFDNTLLYLGQGTSQKAQDNRDITGHTPKIRTDVPQRIFTQ